MVVEEMSGDEAALAHSTAATVAVYQREKASGSSSSSKERDAEGGPQEEAVARFKSEALDLVRVLAALRDDEDYVLLRQKLSRARDLLGARFADGTNHVRGDARKRLDQGIAKAAPALSAFAERCQIAGGPTDNKSNGSPDSDEVTRRSSVYLAWLRTQGDKLVRNTVVSFTELDEDAIRKVFRGHDGEFYARQYGDGFLSDKIMDSVHRVRLQKRSIRALADLEATYGGVVDEYFSLLAAENNGTSSPTTAWPAFALLPAPKQMMDPVKNKAHHPHASDWVRTLSRRDLLRLAFSRDHRNMLFAHLAVLLFIHQDASFTGAREPKPPPYWRESIQRFAVALFATVFPEELGARKPVTILSGLPIDFRRDDEQYVLHLFFDGWYFASARKDAAARVVLLADGYAGGQMQHVFPGLGDGRGFLARAERRVAAPAANDADATTPAPTKNQKKNAKKGGGVASGSGSGPASSSASSTADPSSLVPSSDLYFRGLAQERVFFVQQLDSYRPWMLDVEQGAFFSYKVVKPHEQLQFRRQEQATTNYAQSVMSKSDEVLARELCDEIFHNGGDETGGRSVAEGGAFGPAVGCSGAVASDSGSKPVRGRKGCTQVEIDWFLGLARQKRRILFGGMHFGARHPYFAHCSNFSTLALEDPELIDAVLDRVSGSAGGDRLVAKSNNPDEGIVPFLLPPALEEQDFALEGFYWDGLGRSLCDLTPEQIVQVGLLAVDDEGDAAGAADTDGEDAKLLEEGLAGSDLFSSDDERDKVLAFLRDPKILAEQRRRARQIRREWEAMGNLPRRSRSQSHGKRVQNDADAGGDATAVAADDPTEDRRARLRASLGKLVSQRVKFRRAMQGLNLLRRVGLLQLEASSSSDSEAQPVAALRLQQHGSHLVFHRKGHASVTLVREHGPRKARKELRGDEYLRKMEQLTL